MFEKIIEDWVAPISMIAAIVWVIYIITSYGSNV